jgi:hypothetical protein
MELWTPEQIENRIDLIEEAADSADTNHLSGTTILDLLNYLAVLKSEREACEQRLRQMRRTQKQQRQTT